MTIDLVKRRKVMQRSRLLGHCICDPRKPCPCDVFTGQGLCPCAGERPDPQPAGEIRLTELVSHAGCASKIAPADLQRFLSRLPDISDPAVISGIAAGEDAGIYRLTDELCLIQTVDVMTPVVDDPYTFGAICAANCLSDIYAMGGTPRTALSILAFPAETLNGAIMHAMLAGAMAKLAEANVALIGGHSIKDQEIKLGFAVTGIIAAPAALRQHTAQVGDKLVLTKPLGVGVLNFARQIGRIEADALKPTIASMMALNRAAAEAMREAGASACTDVTGFGLFAHLLTLCRHAGVTARIVAERLPAFPQAVECLRQGIIPGAIERNLEFVGEALETEEGVDSAYVHLGYDAQTSGGLLITVAPDRHEKMIQALTEKNILAATIGELTSKSDGRIVVAKDSSRVRLGEPIHAVRQGVPYKTLAQNIQPEESVMAQPKPSAAPAPCCEGHASPEQAGRVRPGEPSAASPGPSGAAQESLKAFGAFMRTASAGGAVDERTKVLILFALVLLARCQPCVQAHLAKARKMGITQAELDEAAWCAVAIGGGPVKMLYDQVVQADPASGKSCC